MVESIFRRHPRGQRRGDDGAAHRADAPCSREDRRQCYVLEREASPPGPGIGAARPPDIKKAYWHVTDWPSPRCAVRWAGGFAVCSPRWRRASVLGRRSARGLTARVSWPVPSCGLIRGRGRSRSGRDGDGEAPASEFATTSPRARGLGRSGRRRGGWFVSGEDPASPRS